jgi:hypothetical protein
MAQENSSLSNLSNIFYIIISRPNLVAIGFFKKYISNKFKWYSDKLIILKMVMG